MKKKLFLTVTIFAITISSMALPFSNDSTTSKECTSAQSDLTEQEKINNINKYLNSYTSLSNSNLEQSNNLLNNVIAISNMGISVNQTYIDSMLSLSNDIAKMADRILIMSDNIMIMSDKIGTMADRILLTQKLQNANVAMSQSNLLELSKIIDTLKVKE